MMLHEFLIANRSELIRRCRAKVAVRRAPLPTPSELEHGVPLFLDQVTDMFAHPYRDPLRAGSAPPPSDAEARMQEGATRHGDELQRHSYTLEQVVHDYGDLCQAITELAHERDAPLGAAALDSSLADMRAVIDRTLAECGPVR